MVDDIARTSAAAASGGGAGVRALERVLRPRAALDAPMRATRDADRLVMPAAVMAGRTVMMAAASVRRVTRSAAAIRRVTAAAVRPAVTAAAAAGFGWSTQGQQAQ